MATVISILHSFLCAFCIFSIALVREPLMPHDDLALFPSDDMTMMGPVCIFAPKAHFGKGGSL